ncbi:MAG: tyrosine--tRNA ligase [candidate division Zixibacteria bacterium]|nr:tyrosine--tRNA ligase [candidate division Zixibacteria bacterium]
MEFDSPELKKEFEHQWQIISRGAVEIIPEDEFKAKVIRSIKENKPLRVKQGFDPTAPDIHLGHTVGIRKLKQFQDLGHKIVLIVGDYTGLVGDPSGRSETRPMLSYDELMANSETYQKQFFKILDRSRTEIHYNGEWFKEMEFIKYMHLATKFTVARLLERDDFAKRFKNGIPISVHELFYPLMQAYDSVAIRADIELGATEQTFNLLAGRTIQEAFNMEPQCILTLPILVGLDGQRRMSKSLGNYIGIDESPREMFGKVMSIPDEQIYHYFELATDVSLEELKKIRADLSQNNINPMDLKKKLGETLVDMYHPGGSGAEARQEFERIFSQKQLPDEIPEIDSRQLIELEIKPEAIYLVHLMTKTGLSKSNGEARKLIVGGGVYLDNQRITDPDFEFKLSRDMVLKVGKRRFLKLKAK